MLLRLQTLTSFTAFASVNALFSDPGPYPQSYAIFASSFKEPAIPDVVTNFQGHFIQHKWDQNLSHVTAGYWYNSATLGKVRVDEAYDGAFGSSLFDYLNTTTDGVLNKLWSISGSAGSQPTCFVENVSDPGFPLIVADILKQAGATFGGVVNDQWLGHVQSWNFLYGTAIPVIAYLDKDNFFAGFDFWGADRRTKVVTRFLNNVVGEIDGAVFENFPSLNMVNIAVPYPCNLKQEIIVRTGGTAV